MPLKVMYEDLEIAEVVGRGCSSFVLRARHVCTNKPVALKVRQDGSRQPARHEAKAWVRHGKREKAHHEERQTQSDGVRVTWLTLPLKGTSRRSVEVLRLSAARKTTSIFRCCFPTQTTHSREHLDPAQRNSREPTYYYTHEPCSPRRRGHRLRMRVWRR